MVQPIIVSTEDGSATANFMGDSVAEAYMKIQINRVWAQLGIEIEWLEPVDYWNDFAFDGWPTDYSTVARPRDHLSTVIGSAGSPPRHPNGVVLNLFFVDIAAGFAQRGDYSASGVAFLDGNGSTIAIGELITTWEEGRDAAAGVIAHEIGHNLGLDHYQLSGTNLMFSGGRTQSQLIASQQTTIFTDNTGVDGFDFLQSLAPEQNYVNWATINAVLEGASGDDDRDGLSNGFEFLCGTSPKLFTKLEPSSQSASSIVWEMAKISDATEDGFSFTVEGSDDLSEWKAADEIGCPITTLEDSPSVLRVSLSKEQSSGFARFGVVIPPAAAEVKYVPLHIADQHPHTIEDCGHEGCGAVTILPE